MFKRRNKRTWSATFVEAVYPKGGWGRAVRYVQHRMQRLPGTPESIGRGIWAGVFMTFSPLLGLHMVIAAGLAYLIRGNVIAALLATFLGNPITYVPIAAMSLGLGRFILGDEGPGQVKRSIVRKIGDASLDLWYNFLSLFTDNTAEWDNLARFADQVFYPYLLGGVIIGLIAASLSYYLCVPLIRAYQNRRRGQLRAKLAELKNKAVATAKRDGPKSGD